MSFIPAPSDRDWGHSVPLSGSQNQCMLRQQMNHRMFKEAQVSDRANNSQDKPHSPTGITCDLSEARAFFPTRNTPHVPVLAAFAGGRLHVCRSEGSWDLDRAASENPDALFRSIRMKDSIPELEDLTFKFGPRAFLCADNNRIIAYASTHTEAENLVAQFSKAYLKPPAPSGGTFYMIEENRFEIRCQTVTLPPDTILSAEARSLHYGSGSGAWHQDFVQKLREKNCDVIVANDGRVAMESDENEVTIFFRGGEKKKISRAPKKIIARELVKIFENVCEKGLTKKIT